MQHSMPGQIDVLSDRAWITNCEIQTPKGNANQCSGIATRGERLTLICRRPRLRPRRIGVHTRQTSGITGRIKASAIKGRTTLAESQQSVITARDRPQTVFDAGVNPKLFLQLNRNRRNIEVTVAESKHPVMGHARYHFTQKQVTIPKIQGGPGVTDHQTLDTQVAPRLHQYREAQIDTEMAM